MRRVALTLALLFVSTSSLQALQTKPWLGNWLEFEGSLYQTHTESHHVATRHATKEKELHSELTTASLEFMPLADLSTELELDLAKTQKKPYGFEAVKGGFRYSWLNDLAGDPVSLTTGLAISLSTASRVKDLSSKEHGVFETAVQVACGREFGYTEESYWHVWLATGAGLASSGSPWLGGEIHFKHVFQKEHSLDLFVQGEKCFSSHDLSHLSQFHSWSRVRYEYEEVGVKYAIKKEALGSLFLQLTRRIHARFCPTQTWSVQLGIDIPFSPW